MIINACAEAANAWNKYVAEYAAFKIGHGNHDPLPTDLCTTPKRIYAAHRLCNGHGGGPFYCDCPCGGRATGAREAVGAGPL